MLIEDSSLDDIVAYFERAGISIRVHNERPAHSPAGDPPLQVRCWVDLIGSGGETGWPHFGSGQD